MERPPLIFDLDGTLFDAEKLAFASFKQLTEEMVEKGFYPKREWTSEMYRHVIGMTFPELFRYLFPGANQQAFHQAESLLEEIEQDFLQEKQAGNLFRDVTETLMLLKEQGHALYIASNGGAMYVPTVLRVREIYHLFDGVYCCGLHKTSCKEELVELLLKEHNLSSETIMIGDRTSDITAGKFNHLRTIGCLYGFGGEAELQEADVFISEFSELPHTIQTLTNMKE
ncbi:HAD family hydrolase [Bacillus tianshenii]|nr:HAD family hydrolase [Bacillus tianshenii]